MNVSKDNDDRCLQDGYTQLHPLGTNYLNPLHETHKILDIGEHLLQKRSDGLELVPQDNAEFILGP